MENWDDLATLKIEVKWNDINIVGWVVGGLASIKETTQLIRSKE